MNNEIMTKESINEDEIFHQLRILVHDDAFSNERNTSWKYNKKKTEFSKTFEMNATINPQTKSFCIEKEQVEGYKMVVEYDSDKGIMKGTAYISANLLAFHLLLDEDDEDTL